jgi:hypothetical protein
MTTKKTPKTIKAPTAGDKSMLRRMVDNLHVSTADETVRTMIRRRLMDAYASGKIVFAAGERTVEAWENAALRIHHANRDLFRAVCTGDLR